MAMGGPRHFEDCDVGATLALLEKGPLTSAHLMRWSAAMENWHRIHYDKPFAIEHDKLPGLLINGSLKQQFILQLLKDWVGPAGWVWKVSFQFRAMNVVGETLSMWGKVSAKRDLPAYGLVDIYKTTFKPLRAALTGREERVLMKLVVRRDSQQVVGAHMVGADAPEIMQGLAVAVNSGLTKTQFDATVGIHPTAAEEFVTMRQSVV